MRAIRTAQEYSYTTRETWRLFPVAPPKVSQKRAAVRGRQETDWYRVFKRAMT